MSPDQFLARMKKGTIAPAYLFLGTEAYGRDRCRAALLDAMLAPEEREEGYAIAACRRCKGYLKELDRRVRRNGSSALVEDWGSPHLDLVARRAGYWRPLPTLLEVATPA